MFSPNIFVKRKKRNFEKTGKPKIPSNKYNDTVAKHLEETPLLPVPFEKGFGLKEEISENMNGKFI